MTAHFLNLFNYDHYANQKIVAAINATNNPENPVRLIAHLLGSQLVWFNRCIGNGAIWPDWKADVFEQTMNNNHTAWVNYLNGLTTDDLQKEISYKNSQNVAFTNKLIDILTQVINHGTHHRAQIGQQLKFAGVNEIPITDYIFYIRRLN